MVDISDLSEILQYIFEVDILDRYSRRCMVAAVDLPLIYILIGTNKMFRFRISNPIYDAVHHTLGLVFGDFNLHFAANPIKLLQQKLSTICKKIV